MYLDAEVSSNHNEKDSLTLRPVPDIILTTLKPQLKNVTAEDVSASLYYLHLNTEDDVRFLEDSNETSVISEEPEPMPPKPLPRKPVPESGRSSLDIDHSLKPSLPNYLASIPKRKPLVAGVSPEDIRLPQLSDPNVQRRPPEPRQFSSDITINTNPLPGLENSRQDFSSRRPEIVTPLKTDGLIGQSSSPVFVGVNTHVNDFSITLIRRDPYSGAQWNVGTIYGQPTSDEAQNRRSKGAKKPYFDMVHLTTPGYNYFRNSPATGYNAETMTEFSTPVGVSRRAEISPVQHRSDSGFSRQIRMEGSSFWGRSSAHKRSQSDYSAERASPRDNDFTRDASLDGLNSSSNDNMLTGVGESRSKGYVFQSPWGGWCKFSTGSGGRTLRCKHSLPAPISARTAGDFTSTAQPPSIVSELRFNLPSSAILTPSTATATKRSSVDSGRFNISKLGQIRNKLSHDKTSTSNRPALPPRPNPTSYAAMYPSDDEVAPPLPPRSAATSQLRPGCQQTPLFPPSNTQLEPDLSYSDEGDEDDRLNLSIGREKAGGGNRGKRAKLGKLIIHDEGFKMLDLAVAANMAIWWSSVWEFDNR